MAVSTFRQQQRLAGIWNENKDALFFSITPRQGQKEAYEAIEELIIGKKRLVLLIGESRSGKSWLGSGYINSRLIDEFTMDIEKSAKYMTFFELELALRTAQTLENSSSVL